MISRKKGNTVSSTVNAARNNIVIVVSNIKSIIIIPWPKIFIADLAHPTSKRIQPTPGFSLHGRSNGIVCS